MRALLRVDAGGQIGLGHLHRSLALAQALTSHGGEASFILYGDGAALELLGAPGLPAVSLPQHLSVPEEAQTMASRIREQGADVVVVDTYRADQDYLLALARTGVVLVSIDDLAQISFPSHLVVNGNAYGPDLPYRSLTGHTQFLLGTKYALLREEFQAIPKRRTRQHVEQVLVTLGGADPEELTPAVLEALGGIEHAFQVTLVVGPFFGKKQEIRRQVDRSKRPTHLVVSPPSLAELMVAHDVAISGGGQTLYQLAAAGLPAIAICLAENQRANVQSMDQLGAVKAIYPLEDLGWPQSLATDLINLLGSATLRQEMAETGQALVDGLGARRVAAAISALCLSRQV